MIYCVEDDSSIRELMVYTLNSTGFQAVGLEDAASFWKALDENVPELILLDIMLPDEDGISILRKLRRQYNTMEIPVIMATAKGAEYDKVLGLDLGADDYLAKPFGMMEMVSRIRAVLRRVKKPDNDVLSVGSISLNKREHSVHVDGEPVELTRKEYELLNLFLEHVGQVFTRDAILLSVWDEEFVGESRTVDVHVATLRAKLGDAGDMIKTVRGVGYRMEEA
ncbi:MAG: winged helix-turn-helix domain-containing protein [Anaerovoracaceae bacterium]|jgi:two-component system alkaline phosphatase synthesis response regulator PhoP